MIFCLDASVIDIASAKQLSELLILICNGNHKLEYTDVAVWTFIEQDVMTTQNVGQYDIDAFFKNQAMRDIQNNDRDYLRCLTVGSQQGQVDLNSLSIILKEKSCVVLENSANEWPVIKRWIDFVKNDREYKDINTKVLSSITNKSLISEHAGGGNGTIVTRMEYLAKNTYSAVTCILKMTTLFDSDKVSDTDSTSHNDALISFLTEKHYDYCEWKRRELENYIPLRVYEACNYCNKRVAAPNTTPNIWDYTDIGKHPYMKGKYQKKNMPNLALNLDKDAVTETFSNEIYTNPVDKHPISELQYVIFLLAKFI